MTGEKLLPNPYKKLTICFLSSKHTPRDKRVFDKEAVSLANAGFRVLHLAPDDKIGNHERGVEIVTYSPPSGLWGRIVQLPLLYKKAAQINAECYHCNEVDSWLVGVLLKITHSKLIVFDVHEHYPSTFAESRFPRWLHPVIAESIRLVFRLLTPLTDRIVLAKKSVSIDFMGSKKKQVLVQNFTSLAYRDMELPQKLSQDGHNPNLPITAFHLGLIGRKRGWSQLLDALTLVNSKNIHVKIVGTFNDGSQREFENRVLELGLQERIELREWMPFEQAFQELIVADIGLVLFQPGIQNHVFALPHKIFDYMLAGLPVIAPEFAEELSPIVREAQCGLLIDPSKPEQIANALDNLATNPLMGKRLGLNGRQAVIEKYNWESEAVKLIDMYLELAREVK